MRSAWKSGPAIALTVHSQKLLPEGRSETRCLIAAFNYSSFAAVKNLVSALPHWFIIIAFALCCGACGGTVSRPAAPPPAPAPPAASAPDSSEAEAVEGTIRFLEERVKKDPEDFIALNKLNGYYLQRAQESGDVRYLELAARAARDSLKSIPAEMNPGGLAGLAQTVHNLHDFAAARDHALKLTQLEPRKSYPQRILGDALLELGDYDRAEEAYRRMQKLNNFESTLTSEVRLARVDQLRGRPEVARKRFEQALLLALDQVPQQREVVAWCRWQLGEAAFARGDYAVAEQHYRDALVTLPDYYRATASLARVQAANGDLNSAIAGYEKVVKQLPDPSFVAALGDLYKLAGREREAASQYALVEQIARLSELNGALYNRQLALFYADHDMKAAEAYALAKREYELRRDIYGADALAWTALKAGKLDEAQSAIKEALRLNTEDAKLFYHAGMIARAAGDRDAARAYLSRALKLNPKFDPLQSPLVEKALAG